MTDGVRGPQRRGRFSRPAVRPSPLDGDAPTRRDLEPASVGRTALDNELTAPVTPSAHENRVPGPAFAHQVKSALGQRPSPERSGLDAVLGEDPLDGGASEVEAQVPMAGRFLLK
jgi:hypothetical protein